MKGACKWAQQYGPLLGRLLLANLFIVAGFKKITGFAASAGYMAAKMPALDPNVINIMLVLTIAIELGGGLMILVGWQARWAAALIFLWMIPVTWLFHAYWGLTPEQMRAEFIQFQKNLAIMGALLLVVAQGTGAYSLGKDKC